MRQERPLDFRAHHPALIEPVCDPPFSLPKRTSAIDRASGDLVRLLCLSVVLLGVVSLSFV